ncbi:MAG: DUF2993 domain-containing protein [Leptolyngbya sp. SIO4C5]|nr:DUF2993 domain-containing protein [Leptolyngbya sp. SIO4C5]
MELITILLSGLLTLISPVGFVVDQVAEDNIRSRLISADELVVRVDNAPSFQLLQGKVDHVRVAGRGIVPVENLRIAAFELETDTVDFNLERLRRGDLQLDAPFQAAMRLELDEQDINQFLASPGVAERLSNLSFDFFSSRRDRRAQRYRLENPQINFIGNNRLQIEVDIKDIVADEVLDVVIETGIAIAGGSDLRLVDPAIAVDGEPAPSQLVQQLIDGINTRLNLQTLETSGVMARVLELKINESTTNLALFVRVEPSVLAAEESP